MSATSEPIVGAVESGLVQLPGHSSAAVLAPPHPAPAPLLRLLPPLPPAREKPAPRDLAALRLSVVIPATDSPASLGTCIAAIRGAADPPGEIVVIESPRGTSPAAARNLGAELTTGDVIVFVDADVEVHPDAFRRIRATLHEDTGAVGLFGSYDDDPGGDGIVSHFRNLLHHHVHQRSSGSTGTFWAGLGAIRREAFLSAGGFVEHPIEDIELGMRLAAAGESIRLEPRLQGKHLKRWTIRSMVRTDLLVRGAPWIGLALRHRTSPTVLNLGWRHRFSALAAVGACAGLALRRPAAVFGALGAFLGLNRSFYMLLLRRRGPTSAASGIVLHLLHHLTGVAAVPTGIVLYVRQRGREKVPCESDSSA